MTPRLSVICFRGFYLALSQQFFIFLTTLYTMLVLDFRLTALVLLFLPLIFLLVNLYRKSQSRLSRKPEVSCLDINSKLAENIEGIRIIQAFNQEKRLQAEFDEINQEHLVYANRSVALDALFLRPAMSLLKLLGYAVLIGLLWLPWSFYWDNSWNHVCLYPVYQPPF